MVDVVANEAAKVLQRRLDTIQFNIELVGKSAGRMRRFFTESVHGMEPTEEEKKKQEFQSRILRSMVQKVTQERLDHLKQQMVLAETQSYESLIASQERFDALKELFERMLGQAQELPDGRRVFLSRSGEFAVDENGKRLTDEEMTSVEWELGNPTAEDFLRTKEKLEGEAETLSRIQSYREDLEGAQERLKSGNPLTVQEADEMERLLQDIPEFEATAPKVAEKSDARADVDVGGYESASTGKPFSVNNP